MKLFVNYVLFNEKEQPMPRNCIIEHSEIETEQDLRHLEGQIIADKEGYRADDVVVKNWKVIKADDKDE